MRLTLLIGAIAISRSAAAQTGPEPRPAGEDAPAPKGEPPSADRPPAAPAWHPLDDLLGFPVHGRLALKYRGRWFDPGGGSELDHEHDNDLYPSLTADIGDPEKHTLTAHFFVRGSYDLDRRGGGEAQVFDDITNTYRKSAGGRIYYAYLDAHRLGPIQKARLGRQTLTETPIVFHFDGLRADSETWKEALSLQAGVYGGVPVHTYESSARGDGIAGAFLQAKPWPGGRLRADFTWIRDRFDDAVERDRLLGASGWQTLWEMLTIHARYTMLDWRSRDVLARADFYATDWGFRVGASFYRLLRRQEVETFETDQYVLFVGDYRPYWQGRLLVAEEFCENFSVEAGADVRRLADSGDDAPYNREFQRGWLTPTLADWPIGHVSVSVTGEYWDVPHAEDGDYRTWGADLAWKPSKEFKASLGTSFALYKTDVLSGAERERVRTWYAKCAWTPVKPLKLEFEYEFEDLDDEDFHVLKAGMTLSF